MNRFKLSTLSLALLGGLALTACDNTADTAAVDTYEADATAAMQPVDDIAPESGVTDPAAPAATDGYNDADPATTMGDVGEYDETLMQDQEPTLAPEPDPMEPEYNDGMDPAEPVDETQPPQ